MRVVAEKSDRCQGGSATVLTMTVHVELMDDVAVVVIDRPDKRNAVDLDTLRGILDAQAEARRRDCRILVVRGAPPAFCSGADLDGAELGEFTDALGNVLRGFGLWPGVTVAYIDGPALGAGLQIAIACDIRVATHNSIFGIPAAKLGLAVDTWTVERLTREVGWSQTRTMLLTGDPVQASDMPTGFLAREIEERDHETSLSVMLDLVRKWSQRAPLTIAAHKSAIEMIAGAGISRSDVEAARLAAWNSDDAREGRAAFLERRPPTFRGR